MKEIENLRDRIAELEEKITQLTEDFQNHNHCLNCGDLIFDGSYYCSSNCEVEDQ